MSLVDQPVQQNVMPHGYPGLEYLAQVDQLIVKQCVELLEVATGFETKNRYRVVNSLDQPVYLALEESTPGERLCCRTTRAFTLHFTDYYEREILVLERPNVFGAGCCTCDEQPSPMTVRDMHGTILGIVRSAMGDCSPHVSIFEADGATMLYDIRGPFWPCQCACGCTEDIDYPIKMPGYDSEVGRIRKLWSGFVREAHTSADVFSVTFPIDLDVRHKALMLASVFVIDYHHYEDNQGRL